MGAHMAGYFCTCELTLVSKLESLKEISPWLKKAWDQYKLPDCRRFDLSVCLYEAVANIIMYAYERPMGQRILVALKVRDNLVEITVEDDGRPFNPLDHPETSPPSSICDATIGGHGIAIIRRLSDRLDYERRASHNIFTITHCLIKSSDNPKDYDKTSDGN